MKITRRQLKQLIKEEIQHINENTESKKIDSDFRDLIKNINDVFEQGFSGDWGNLTINFPDESFDNSGSIDIKSPVFAGPDSKSRVLDLVNKISPTTQSGLQWPYASKVDALRILVAGLHMGALKK
jgi:hypothetical protein